MGGSASKATTNVAKAATEAAVPASSRPSVTSSTAATTTASSRYPVHQGGPAPSADGKRYAVDSASSTKSSTIRKDAADPSGMDIRQISRNLASLGQATVASAQKHNAARFGKVGDRMS